MTYEEAKAFFEENLKYGKCSENCTECNAIELAIYALEKQIPKKPKECGEDWFVCPKCETSIVSLDELETHKFCLNCGQALDWSDTE